MTPAIDRDHAARARARVAAEPEREQGRERCSRRAPASAAKARLSQICALSRSVSIRAAAAGQMNMAITRIEPTASNAATATAPTNSIRPRFTSAGREAQRRGETRIERGDLQLLVEQQHGRPLDHGDQRPA